jgi:hypothetical protein
MDQENLRSFAANFADIFPGLAYVPGLGLDTKRVALSHPAPFPSFHHSSTGRRTRGGVGAAAGGVSQAAPVTRREFLVDGVAVPKLNLGEAGRAELKSLISKKQKEQRDLKAVCDRIAKVKSASIVELLTIARICGLWEEAERIAANKPKPSTRE